MIRILHSCPAARGAVLLLLWSGLLPGLVVAQMDGQAPLPTITLNAGVYLIQAEVASSYSTRERGLMFRKRMAANHGMLFVFPQDGQECMWMKNTPLPLSVAFIDAAGTIVNIEDMAPQSEDTHCSARPVRYALEMNRGWFASKGIESGVRLHGLEEAPPAR